MNLPDLIDISEEDSKKGEFVRTLLDIAVIRVYKNGKPLTEIIKEIEDKEVTPVIFDDILY